MNNLTRAILIGIGATAVLDIWGFARLPLLGQPVPDYGTVGRWIAHMRHGQFRHAAISRAEPVRGERALGWTVHYLIGMFFGAVLVWSAGTDWLAHPTPGPALAVGIGSVAAPFLVMQPGMGAGIAASRSPNPRRARLQSLITHAVFGIGLYLTALALALFPPFR